jgi:hypothetical protein
VDGQPPTGRASPGRSIGPVRRSCLRPVDSAASTSGCWRTPATLDCSTSLNDTCLQTRNTEAVSLRYSRPNCCRTWSRLSRKVVMVGGWGRGWSGRMAFRGPYE